MELVLHIYCWFCDCSTVCEHTQSHYCGLSCGCCQDEYSSLLVHSLTHKTPLMWHDSYSIATTQTTFIQPIYESARKKMVTLCHVICEAFSFNFVYPARNQHTIYLICTFCLHSIIRSLRQTVSKRLLILFRCYLIHLYIEFI